MKKSNLHVKKIKWQDMGTLKQFQEIQKQSNLLSIEKSNEFIYFINNKVIKFFTKEKIIDNKILKAKMKPLFFPNTKKIEKNFYYYDYLKGDIFYNSGNADLFKKLLILLEKNFWISKKVNKNKMKNICKTFYQDKTIDRINLFLDLNPQYLLPKTVNKEKIFSLKYILKKIPWNLINDGTACFIHGDLNFSNILYDKKNNKFMLIDWRQDFAGEIDFGDIYYDLAKLYAGITMNFNHIIKGQYKYIEKNRDLKISFKSWNQSNEYKKILEDFIVKRSFDLKKVKLLSGLTYLNMAALHPEPINKILIAFGLLIISRELDK
jgi:thiamine kinase-like enzyme